MLPALSLTSMYYYGWCSYHILVQCHFFLHIQAYSGESETRQPFVNVPTSPSILNLEYYPCTFSLHGFFYWKEVTHCKEFTVACWICMSIQNI